MAATHQVAFAQTPLQFIRLHRLDPVTDGGRPAAGVVQANDGLFYGTTICGGGTFDCSARPDAGTVFRLDGVSTLPDGSAFSALHAFTGGADGGSPYAPLIQATNRLLYGTTTCGGSSNCPYGSGTIFSIDPAGGGFTTVHVFNGGTDGTSPYGGLVQGRDGKLYGTTYCGGGGGDCLSPLGPFGGGTIFRLDPTNGAFTTLHAFSDTDLAGCLSLASLVEDTTTTGVFYGTMAWCGANGRGTVFKIDVSKNSRRNVTVLHSFTGAADGADPAAPLLIGLDGSLYGTSELGGFANVGTLFKLTTGGTGFTTLHTFAAGLDGGDPYAGLIQAHDGTLYGTTFYHSVLPGQTGTIFRLDPGSGQFETVYTFTGGLDGQNPSGRLAQIDESLAPGFTGSLVGTTLFGGNVTNSGSGIIFRFVPPPLLICPASVVTNATGAAGASVTLSTTLIDPANTATTITWSIDGIFFRADLVPAASSVATSTRTTKSLTASYLAGKAGTLASLHAVSIQSVDALGLTSSCAVTVEVDKLDQAITFAAVPVQTYWNPNGTVVLNATASSGATPTNRPVTFTVVSGPGSLSANTLTITGAGAIVVQASQAGNGQYNPAPDVSQTITVNKAAQTITFPTVAAQTIGNPPVTLAATASSGLAVTYSISGPGTISGNVLTITGAGTIIVTASQPGNGNYHAAVPVQQNITVLNTSQTATATTLAAVPTAQAVGQPITLTATVVAVAPGSGVPNGTVTFTDGTTVLGTATLNASGVATLATTTLAIGPHSITASYSGSSNYRTSAASATSVLVYGYAAGGGAFVIGDLNAINGNAVTFWSAQWEKTNSLTGPKANASFKGFANTLSTTPPVAGGTWTTGPGNSSEPPASIPAYMAVIVASTDVKSGSIISGNTVKIVIVRTIAGYAANPGHAGTGTIVAILP